MKGSLGVQPQRSSQRGCIKDISTVTLAILPRQLVSSLYIDYECPRRLTSFTAIGHLILFLLVFGYAQNYYFHLRMQRFLYPL